MSFASIAESHAPMKAFRDVGIPVEKLLSEVGSLVCVFDCDGHILFANAHWLDMLNYSIDDVDAMNFFTLVFDLNPMLPFSQHMQRLQQGETIASLQFAVRTAEGSLRVVEGSFIPHHVDGHLESVTGIWQDVTGHKTREAELNRIFELSLDMLGITSFDGVFVKVNPAVHAILGYDPDEFIGHNIKEFLHPDDVQRTLDAAHQANAGRNILQFENRYRHKEGSYRWLSWKSTSVVDEQRTYFIARDITRQKQIEMQLLLRNQAIEASPSGISIADARLPDMPLIYVNPAFQRLTGYSAIDAIGRNCRFLQGDDREQAGVDEIRLAIKEQRGCTVVIRNYRRNGELFYNELRIAPIFNVEGELTHFVGISTDVTERVTTSEKIQQQTEALLQMNHSLSVARKQAEEAVRLKSQFLATMSHELRTPLNAIIGYTDIQLAGMTGDLTEEQTYYQDRVLVNAKHLLELINDVLDISKIEAGRMEILNKPFTIQDWLDDIVAQVEGLAEQKDLSFESHLDDRMPQEIIGDAARLRQIAINLLSNAIKFTDTGFVRVQIHRHGRDAWKLAVSDSGVGIPSHMQETVFEEFRQVDESSRRKQGGSGLGLAIVRKLCLMMGGTIRVQSQVGKGTTFTVIMPLVTDHKFITDQTLNSGLKE